MLHSIAFDTLMRASRNLQSIRRFRLNSILNQCPKIEVILENKNYQIQTVTQSKDLLALLKLRNKTAGLAGPRRLSIPSFTYTDCFDSVAEHVSIRNLHTGQIIGGFRLLSSLFTEQFSSEGKFDLESLKIKNGTILELSQLFLLSEHKHKDLMKLTARFLSDYSLKSKDEYIISAQDIRTDSNRGAALVYRYFQTLGIIEAHINCRPKSPGLVSNLNHWVNHFHSRLSKSEMEESLSLLSETFKETLSLGASVAGLPAKDHQTNHIDFLTILHKEDLNRALWKKSQNSLESLSG